MPRTNVIVDPGGGGDYTSAQLAENALDGTNINNNYSMLCRKNAQTVGTLTVAGWTIGTPSADAFVHVGAEANSGFKGYLPSTLASIARIESLVNRTPWTHYGVIPGDLSHEPLMMRVDNGWGIQVDHSGTGQTVNSDNIRINGMVFIINNPADHSGVGARIWNAVDGGTLNVTLTNCIFYLTGNAESFSDDKKIVTCNIIAPAANATMNLNIENNLFISDVPKHSPPNDNRTVNHGLGIGAGADPSNTVNAIVRNNYFLDLNDSARFDSAISIGVGGTVNTAGSGFNAARDSSVDLLGPNNITDIVASDEFIDPTSDWRFKPGARGLTAGTHSLTYDMFNRSRTQSLTSLGPMAYEKTLMIQDVRYPWPSVGREVSVFLRNPESGANTIYLQVSNMGLPDPTSDADWADIRDYNETSDVPALAEKTIRVKPCRWMRVTAKAGNDWPLQAEARILERVD